MIRDIDPDNIIIVGSAQWSRQPHNVTAAGLGQTNIACSWHGYVTWEHQNDWESSDADSWNTTVPVIVTEWGLGNNKNDGGLLDIYKSRGVINCFWSMSNIGGDEVKWSVLKETCNKISGWTAEDITENGAFILGKTKEWVNFYPVDLDVEPEDEVYTEFVEETGTLTYYYDDKIDTRTGVTELYIPGSIRFTGYNEKVLKGVIDPSMKNAPITSMRGMFEGGFNSETFKIQDLKKMTSIVGLENLNTSIVTDMNGMFSGCESLTALDLSSFDTKNVTNFAYMFMGCTGLQIVDVNSFDISNATDMRGMFSSCWELTTICCSNDWSNCQADTYIMFSGCKKLVGDKGTVFDNNTLDKTYARPDGGTSAPGYFTADTMTGIKKVQDVQKVQGVQESIYNLSGQRVNKPVQKGLYIINGKKMMVK